MKIIECPRDAMQGISTFIPTELKAAYLQALLEVGFDTLDFGSFVSPKAVPQLADTAEVLAKLDLSQTQTKLLAIVANMRGAEAASSFDAIDYWGYPFSISETFQVRNTRKTIAESLELVKAMQDLALSKGKSLVIYISMAFGNPYRDDWSPALAAKWVDKMAALEIKTIALADTVGSADQSSIAGLFETLIPAYPGVEFGAHFHASPAVRDLKIAAAYEKGCRRFDTALNGFGGCPFAEDELVGNIATENLISFCQKHKIELNFQQNALDKAKALALHVFHPAH